MNLTNFNVTWRSFRSADESWKRAAELRFGFIDPSPCDLANTPRIRNVERVIFTAIIAIFEIEEAATPCKCVDHRRFYRYVEKQSDERDSRRSFIFAACRREKENFLFVIQRAWIDLFLDIFFYMDIMMYL